MLLDQNFMIPVSNVLATCARFSMLFNAIIRLPECRELMTINLIPPRMILEFVTNLPA